MKTESCLDRWRSLTQDERYMALKYIEFEAKTHDDQAMRRVLWLGYHALREESERAAKETT